MLTIFYDLPHNLYLNYDYDSIFVMELAQSHLII